MKPKLYIKNENGEFERYKEPEPPYNNVLYRKSGNRYEPYSMLLSRELGEGVWVVTKHTYGKSFTSGEYLRNCFLCQKASDIQEVSLAKLGGMEKLAAHLSENWNKLPKETSQYDLCRAIVGILFEYKEKNNEIK